MRGAVTLGLRPATNSRAVVAVIAAASSTAGATAGASSWPDCTRL